ncbi:hypothetical protein [Thalassospira profundimaris]|uniref:hypothetical protein n=1 Tax=Thalassospira profundimaris TaxID=502049 RepID=UPI0011BD9FB7|nr:hypothetical protein [Thalassospira profundimaris]
MFSRVIAEITISLLVVLLIHTGRRVGAGGKGRSGKTDETDEPLGQRDKTLSSQLDGLGRSPNNDSYPSTGVKSGANETGRKIERTPLTETEVEREIDSISTRTTRNTTRLGGNPGEPV